MESWKQIQIIAVNDFKTKSEEADPDSFCSDISDSDIFREHLCMVEFGAGRKNMFFMP